MTATPVASEVIRRGDPGYEAARRASCRNQHLPDRFPDGIVHATSADAVAAAIREAVARDWKVGVRSGGHSFSCNHVRDGGLLLDVSALDEVTIDDEAMVARVGPGCRGNALDGLLAERGLYFPVGHCSGVGLGGYLLQGGFGWNSRVMGMACESVLAIDYVDGNGDPQHASPTHNADVFWAARGAGPGFFGVVTRYHLRLYPRPPVIGGRLGVYPLDRLADVVRWFHQVGPDVPATVELMFAVSRRVPHDGEPGIMVMAPVFADSVEQAEEDLSFLESRPAGARDFLPFSQMTLETMTSDMMSMLPEEHFYVVDNTWTHAPVDDLLPDLERILEELPEPPAHFIWLNWSPKRTRPDMAFSLEDEVYLALYGLWQEPAHEEAVTQWVRRGMERLSPHSTGIQLADENLARRDAEFMARANRERLEAARRLHDPAGRFHGYGSDPA